MDTSTPTVSLKVRNFGFRKKDEFTAEVCPDVAGTMEILIFKVGLENSSGASSVEMRFHRQGNGNEIQIRLQLQLRLMIHVCLESIGSAFNFPSMRRALCLEFAF